MKERLHLCLTDIAHRLARQGAEGVHDDDAGVGRAHLFGDRVQDSVQVLL